MVYVHPTTLGVPGEKSEKVTYERTDWGVKTTRWTFDGEPIAFHRKFGNFPGNVDRWQFYLMYIPSVAIIDFGGAATGSGAREGRRDGVRLSRARVESAGASFSHLATVSRF